MTTDIDWYGPDTATFGDRLAAAREAGGMTGSQLARRLGVKKSTVSDWENDLSEPRANRLAMMAGVLNVSIIWLLTGEGEGMSAPADAEDPADMGPLLAELREIRATLRQAAERAARLEKRLRALSGEPA